MLQNLQYNKAEDDQRVNDFTIRTANTINKKLADAGQKADFIYLNDAGGGQEVFENYGPGNLDRLRTIRDKYDPDQVFTVLEAGGWKVQK